MYYEEKIINGKLMCRHTPTGAWHEVSYETLLRRYIELKEKQVLQ